MPLSVCRQYHDVMVKSVEEFLKTSQPGDCKNEA
jgi:hypothetical protein